MLNILSCGAGVQSTTVYLMSCMGLLPKLDHTIFSDTGWEPKAVYTHLAWLQSLSDNSVAASYGLDPARVCPIEVVSCGSSIRSDTMVAQVRGKAIDGQRWASMPLYTLEPNKDKEGQIKRQCTSEYKIEPIERRIKELLGLATRSRYPKTLQVRHWFGISADEFTRCRKPVTREKKQTGTDLLGEPIFETITKPILWKSHFYPLLAFEFIGDKTRKAWELPCLDREGCFAWLDANGFPRPPRSACIGCPFRGRDEWLSLTPEEFEDACEVDEAIRNSGGMRGQMFLHRSCVPLREVDFTIIDPSDTGMLQACMGDCNT